MKIKIALVFIIIGAISVVGIFFLKNYLSYDSFKQKLTVNEKQSDQLSQKVQLKSLLKDQKFVNYFDQETDLKAFSEQILSGQKKMILHFWASWCGPCIQEIPELIHFYNNTENKEKYDFLIISMDYTLEDLQKFRLSFPQLVSPMTTQVWDKDSILSRAFQIDKLPATVIFKNEDQIQKINGLVDWKNFK